MLLFLSYSSALDRSVCTSGVLLSCTLPPSVLFFTSHWRNQFNELLYLLFQVGGETLHGLFGPSHQDYFEDGVSSYFRFDSFILLLVLWVNKAVENSPHCRMVVKGVQFSGLCHQCRVPMWFILETRAHISISNFLFHPQTPPFFPQCSPCWLQSQRWVWITTPPND